MEAVLHAHLGESFRAKLRVSKMYVESLRYSHRKRYLTKDGSAGDRAWVHAGCDSL